MRRLPDDSGRFGRFGGRFVPETLMAPLLELEATYARARRDRRFQTRLRKREDLCHTGAHKINNVLGQALLAQRMGKPRVIAETGAGQHGVATATAAALLGLECEVYMGTEDVERQALNVFRMRPLGAGVHPVETGSRTLKDAINEAVRDWVTSAGFVGAMFRVVAGAAAGPRPRPPLGPQYPGGRLGRGA